MRFIEPNVEYLPQPSGLEGVWHQIATATRVCYQSQARESESDEDFVKRVLFKPALIEGDLSDLKHCKFNILKLHGGCLEHGTVYLLSDSSDDIIDLHYHNKPYSIVRQVGTKCYITTNMRYIIEYNYWDDLRCICEPTENHFKRYTFKVTTDIGVTREMNRHRTFSICEQSTRYCDFSKDKFGGELTFIKPAWTIKDNAAKTCCGLLEDIESTYKYLREDGWKPEQARQILPLGLKTEAVYTAFADDWKHFISLRADNASGKAHPNIQYIANEIKRIAKEQRLWQR